MHAAILALLLGVGLVDPARAATNAQGAVAPPSTAASTPATDEAYQRLLEQDDDALLDIERWLREEQSPDTLPPSHTRPALQSRIAERTRPVREAYEDFLKRHPEHARAHLAYGSFLMELGDENLAVEHMEQSRRLDTDNPAAWNNLANHYGHRGPVKRAFDYYARAITLNPREPVYYQNLATTVFLFRKDAVEHFQLSESQVFEKSLDLYRQAIKLDPTNFMLASDYAQSFYGIRPASTNGQAAQTDDRTRLANQAVHAWEYALKLAGDDLQREGVKVHLARNHLLAGRPGEARRVLFEVTHPVYATLKQRVLRNIERFEAGQPLVQDEGAKGPPPGAAAPP
jgi:tetratricopeptide (TPR) repeat protein